MAKARKSGKRSAGGTQARASGMLAAVLAAVVGGFGSGVVKLDWTDGNPGLSFDQAQLAKLSGQLGQLATSVSGQSTPPAISSSSQPASADSAMPQDGQVPPLSNVSVPPSVPRGGDSIKIATYNIQVFGTSKLNKPKAMQVLASIVRQFDVVAIQEVRSTDDNVVPSFVNLINAEGARYDFVIGPRLGRTNSKEQYAIIFDTARIEVDRSSVYTTPDPQDLLHREPMAARFRVRGVAEDRAFTFTLVDIHTDPDDTKSELNALADTFVGVQQNGSGEDDVILLGDLNVDENHLGNLGRLPDIGHAITKVTTNTRRTRMYDNIIFNRLATTEFMGRAGVVDVTKEFGLSESEALEVSDHFPAWAEFSAYESGNALPVVSLPGRTR